MASVNYTFTAEEIERWGIDVLLERERCCRIVHRGRYSSRKQVCDFAAECLDRIRNPEKE